MTRKTGRQFFSNPGPTNIPDSVLRAMNRATIDFNDPEFMDVYNGAMKGLKSVLRMAEPGSDAVLLHRLRPRLVGGDARQPALPGRHRAGA